MKRNTQTTDRTVGVAMLAVTTHAVDRGLTAWRIEHTSWAPADGITIHVTEEHADAWLDSVLVIGEPQVKRGNDETSRIELLAYPALLPSAIGDVRVTISTDRVVPLHLVGGAS